MGKEGIAHISNKTDKWSVSLVEVANNQSFLSAFQRVLTATSDGIACTEQTNKRKNRTEHFSVSPKASVACATQPMPCQNFQTIECIAPMDGEPGAVSLLALPTELLYRICDFLDPETLLLSFRLVCRHFHEIAHAYNQYEIRYPSDPKVNLCRLILPEHVVSLDFWDRSLRTDWVALFLARFNIHQFTRLRSLSLPKIEMNDLLIILQHLTTHCQLSSLSIHSDISTVSIETLHLLSLAIAQPALRQLALYANLAHTNDLVWPMHCTIRRLSIDICHIQQFCAILRNSPHLHSLSMNNCFVNRRDEISPSESYLQLTSLTLNDVQMTMDKLELLLCFLPSLVRLDLSSSGKPFEFVQRLSRWEAFLRSRLPRLRQLELCIFCYCCDWENFDAVIDAFRTPFWLIERCWFVTCQFRDDWTSSFTLFTSPVSPILSAHDEHHFDQIICSNSTAFTM